MKVIMAQEKRHDGTFSDAECMLESTFRKAPCKLIQSIDINAHQRGKGE